MQTVAGVVMLLMIYGVWLILPWYPKVSESPSDSVVECVDGDTCLFKGNYGKSYRVRLLGIDAPELNQPGFEAEAEEARVVLDNMVKNCTDNLWYKTQSIDVYGRPLREIFCGNLSLNEALISQGLVYVERAPPKLNKKYKHLEKEARSAQKGVWAPYKNYKSRPRHYRKLKGQPK